MSLEYSEKGIVFFPDPHLEGTPADWGLPYQEVWFTAADGVRLHSWLVPKPGCPLFLWFHGNAGNISHRLENLRLLHELSDVQVFIFDYREYGLSQGRITREGTYLDAAAAYRTATEELGFAPQDIVLFGRSLGTALATDLAARVPCRSLILEAAFTNSQEMARLYAPFLFDWRPSVPYDNLGRIGAVRVPLLVIHGTADEVVPVSMGERVYAAATAPKELYLIPGAHHNDTYLVGGKEYFARLKRFIYHGPQARE